MENHKPEGVVLLNVLIIYTWEKVREHLLCYEGKHWTNCFLKSKNAITKLFNLSKYVVSKAASV